MKVAVVGVGPCGLTTIKQLRDEGHEVVAFEKNSSIGGIWFRHEGDAEQAKVFDSLVLTISMKLMSYSDFMAEGPRAYATHEEYLKYLQAYADAYDLRRHIVFDTTVEEIRKLPQGWQVAATTNGKRIEYHFDAVALCSGPFKTPNAKVEHLDDFTGEVVHSSRYRNNRPFRGKRVLIIGLAESGADIVREVSNVSSECTLSIRSHSLLLPRVLNGNYSTDSFSARALHYESWVRATDVPYRFKSIFGDDRLSRTTFLSAARTYGVFTAAAQTFSGMFAGGTASNGCVTNPQNCMGQPLYPAKLDLFCEDTKENIDFINEWNKRSHKGQGNYSPKVIYCKNVSFVPNIRSGKVVVNDTGIKGVEGKVVHFKDGTSKEFDVIVLCTGFVHDFSILSNAEIPDNNVRHLYKHAIHPDYGGTLALIGFVRPYSGGIPMCAEMQARYLARLLSGRIELPRNVKQIIQEEKAWEESFSIFSPRHFEAIPSQILFCDSIAREIGCLPSMSDLLRQPKVLTKLWFHTFNQACYRLTGPHSMYDRAMKEILNERLPGGSTKSVYFFSLMSMLPKGMHPKDANIPSN